MEVFIDDSSPWTLEQSRRHGGDLVGLAPPNKSPSPHKLKYEKL